MGHSEVRWTCSLLLVIVYSSVQFKMVSMCSKSPYALHPICQKFPAGRDQVRHSEVRWTWSLLLVYSSVQDGICALRKAHMCSTPSVRGFLLAEISEVRWTWSLLLVYSSVKNGIYALRKALSLRGFLLAEIWWDTQR